MGDIKLVDVTLHIDETMEATTRSKVENDLRALSGVVSVHMPEDKPHLVIIEYDPEHTRSSDVLQTVLGKQLHAELVGL